MKTVGLPGVIDRISEARAMGDLSENFDYKAALEDRDLIESRISEIEKLLEGVEIISDKKKGKTSEVDYGSTVTVKFDDGKEYTVTIVGSGEVSVGDDTLHVSFESPLGHAIKGKKAGEFATMRMSGGKQEVQVISVK